MRQVAVIDLGFGDAGKGMTVHLLAQASSPGTVTVRFHGGAQAGHTVVDARGRRHVFTQFGAATLGVQTYSIFARECVFSPTALRKEADALLALGVADAWQRIWVSDDCVVTSPYHVAANRIIEQQRSARHGSCGVGVGETVHMASADHPASILAGDLRSAPTLRHKLQLQRAYYEARIDRTALGNSVEGDIVATTDWWPTWIAQASDANVLGCLRSEADLQMQASAAPTLLFEGAQGVLLDQRVGFAPHTTPSACTLQNIRALQQRWGLPLELDVWGVVRTHMVRHGEGPLPTYDARLTPYVADSTNTPNPWQGPPRYGALDMVLLARSLAAVPEVRQLAVSHLDTWQQLPHREICVAYTDATLSEKIRLPASTQYPLDPLTTELQQAQPRLVPCDDIVGAMGEILQRPVALKGHGADASAWRW